MIYFQPENVYNSEVDFYGTPCPCCGYDLYENHICDHSLTKREKEFAEERMAQQKWPNYWRMF